MVMHRPFPPESVVKRAAVRCRKFADREEWSVEFTVELATERPKTCGKGTVAIDVGWRALPDGIRVASWVGDDGEKGEFLLTHAELSSLGYASKLRSIRDQSFDKARAELIAAIGVVPEHPPWMAQVLATLPLWRNIRRLADLSMSWRENRFLGDEVAFEALEKWRYNEHHLWRWEAHQRIGSIRHRRDVYRVFASELAKRYERVVWEDFDLREVATRADVSQETAENQTARTNRQVVAVSDFRRTVALAFTGRGGSSETVRGAETTIECHACGHIEKFDKAANISHLCAACGALWDQDENAGHNLLARWKEQEAERTGETPAAPAEGRWERAERLRREKEARRGVLVGGPVT
jgi:transposase